MTRRLRASCLAAALAAAVVSGCGRLEPGTGSAQFDPNPLAPKRAEAARPRDGAGIAFASLGFDDALARARSEKRLLMVDLYTTWCGWCKKMDRDVFSDPTVGAASQGLVAIRLDAEAGGAGVADRFRVDGYPTILFLDGDGNLVERVNGYVGVDAFRRVLESLPKAST